MIKRLVFITLLLISELTGLAQGVFESNTSNGDWDDNTSWSLVSGSDLDGIPDSDDDVTILGGDRIDVDPSGVTVSVDDLTIQGQLNFPGNNRTLDVGGNLVMSGSATITGNGGSRTLNVAGNLTVSVGATASIAGQNIDVDGDTQIDGALSFGNNNGLKVFNNVTVSATGTWNNTDRESFTIEGNLINNGSWTGCSNNACLYTFSNTSGSISGSSTITVPDILIDSPAEITNTGTLILTDDFTGTGSYINGVNGSLEFTGSSSFTVSSTDFSASPNTITFSNTNSITIPNTTYHNLIVNHGGSQRTQVAGNVTINNDLTINGGEFRLNSGTSSIGGDVIVQGGQFSPNNAAVNLTISGDVTVSSGIFDFNNGTVSVTGALQIEGGTPNDVNGGSLTVGSLVVDAGQTLELGSGTFSTSGTSSINGQLTIDGSGGTKTFDDIVVSPTGDWNVTTSESFTFNGSITSNGTWTGCSNTSCLYELTSNSGTITGSSAISFADLNIDSPGDYTNSTDVIITDDLTGSGSFTNANGSTLELSGSGPFSLASLDASANANTVTYSGGGSTALNSGDYYNLVINKTGTNTLTVTGATNVGNDLTIDSGVLAIGAATLDVTNNVTINGGELTPNDVAAVLNVGGEVAMNGGLYDHNNGDVDLTGDFTASAGTFTFNGTSTLDADDFVINGASVTLSSGSVNVNNGTGGLTINSGSLTLGGSNLTVANDFDFNSGSSDFNSGTFSTNTMDIASGQIMTMANLTVNVISDTNINGTLTFDNNNGAKTFNNIIVNSGGAWNNASTADFTISGNIQSNGASWVGCSSSNGCDYTLTNTSGTISGTTDVSLSDLVIDGLASYTNQTNLTVTDRFTGTGSFINSSTGNLTLGGATTNITNFTASASGNTVTYNRDGDQTLNATTSGEYYNLIINTNAAGDDVAMISNETILNQLTLNVGDLFLGSNNLVLADGAMILGGSEDSYIGLNGSGIVRQLISSSGASLVYPIGDGNDYSPILSFIINSASFAAGAFYEIDLVDGNLGARNASNTGSGGDDVGTTASSFISRYWIITSSGITNENFSATYQYVEADVNGTEANMVGVVYRQPPGFGFDDWGVFGAVDPTTNTVTVTDVDAFGTLFAMDNTDSRLPVELIDFTAKSVNGAVLLKWSTATEINNDFFIIQRSRDALTWTDLLTVDGAGNSSGVVEYSAYDNIPLAGRSFYRLKQTDFDGSFEYSEVETVLVVIDGIQKQHFKLLPSVLSIGDRLQVRVFGDENTNESLYQILSRDGRVIQAGKFSGSYKEIKMPRIVGGVYIIQLITEGVKSTQKFLVR